MKSKKALKWITGECGEAKRLKKKTMMDVGTRMKREWK